MTKREQRLELEQLSVEIFGSRYGYQKIQRKGLLVKLPDGNKYLMHMTDEGVKEYMLKTKQYQTDMIKEIENKYNKEIEERQDAK